MVNNFNSDKLFLRIGDIVFIEFTQPVKQNNKVVEMTGILGGSHNEYKRI